MGTRELTKGTNQLKCQPPWKAASPCCFAFRAFARLLLSLLRRTWAGAVAAARLRADPCFSRERQLHPHPHSPACPPFPARCLVGPFGRPTRALRRSNKGPQSGLHREIRSIPHSNPHVVEARESAEVSNNNNRHRGPGLTPLTPISSLPRRPHLGRNPGQAARP
jgi:hypothetical protein